MELPDSFSFVNLSSGDLEVAQALLRSNNLPFEDCGDHLANFIGISQDKRLIAIGGFERRSSSHVALLRSVAVESEYRGLKLGAILIKKLLAKLRYQEIEAVYLLTETAAPYFTRLKFETVGRESLPIEIQSTRQCQSLCPASAIAMRLMLK